MAPVKVIPKSLVYPFRVLHCLVSCKPCKIFSSTSQILSAVSDIFRSTEATRRDPGCLLLNLIPDDGNIPTNQELETTVACYSQIVTMVYSGVSRKEVDCSIFIENCRSRLNCEYSPKSATIPEIDNEKVLHFTNIQNPSKLENSCFPTAVKFIDPKNTASLFSDGLDIQTSKVSTELQVHNVVDHGVIGGTFDSIHVGHKLLLSEAALRCRTSLTVGVTDLEMIHAKTLPELIRPVEERMRNVKGFLKKIAPSLETSVVPIKDPFGPSIIDPKLQLIVVSEETLRGGLKVNEKRAANGLSPLKIHQIPVIEDGCRDVDEEEKISSSSLRRRRLGTRLRPLQEKPNLPSLPHVVGLTGSIASGKSSIAKRLDRLGAGIVDCDLLGHQAYVPGTECYRRLVSEFGEEIVATDGSIDRRKLGSIVFASKDALKKLNGIVWPEIAKLAKSEIEKLFAKGKHVVFLDAAVLLEAGWEEFCHEVWVTVIPPEEAVKRIVDRNGLDPEAAKNRIAMQLTNIERVRKADIVLSTLWEPEFTQKQVEKAWEEVQPVVLGKLNSNL